MVAPAPWTQSWERWASLGPAWHPKRWDGHPPAKWRPSLTPTNSSSVSVPSPSRSIFLGKHGRQVRRPLQASKTTTPPYNSLSHICDRGSHLLLSLTFLNIWNIFGIQTNTWPFLQSWEKFFFALTFSRPKIQQKKHTLCQNGLNYQHHANVFLLLFGRNYFWKKT